MDRAEVVVLRLPAESDLSALSGEREGIIPDLGCRAAYQRERAAPGPCLPSRGLLRPVYGGGGGEVAGAGGGWGGPGSPASQSCPPAERILPTTSRSGPDRPDCGCTSTPPWGPVPRSR